MKHEFVDNDWIRISGFLEHSNNLFRSSSFIKNFEILNFILHIYTESNIKEQRVRFKDLKLFTTKSDVYLSNLLKSGLQSNYLSVHLCPADKRSRSYQLTDISLDFIKNLNFELEHDETEKNSNETKNCPYCHAKKVN